MLPAGSTEILRTTSHAQRSRAQAWLVAGFVLACAGWLSRPAAAAGCSHYVATGADAVRSGTAGLDPLVVSGALSKDRGQSSPLGGSPARPCSGFGCSRDSSLPMAAPMAVPRVDAWGCFGLSALALQTHSSPFPFDDDSPHSRDRAERLARPPRS
jgi:hypothetical protein